MPPILSRTIETLVLVIVSVRAPSCAQPSASVGPREHAAFSQSAAGARVLSIARTPLRCEVLSCPSGRLIGFLVELSLNAGGQFFCQVRGQNMTLFAVAIHDAGHEVIFVVVVVGVKRLNEKGILIDLAGSIWVESAF